MCRCWGPVCRVVKIVIVMQGGKPCLRFAPRCRGQCALSVPGWMSALARYERRKRRRLACAWVASRSVASNPLEERRQAIYIWPVVITHAAQLRRMLALPTFACKCCCVHGVHPWLQSLAVEPRQDVPSKGKSVVTPSLTHNVPPHISFPPRQIAQAASITPGGCHRQVVIGQILEAGALCCVVTTDAWLGACPPHPRTKASPKVEYLGLPRQPYLSHRSRLESADPTHLDGCRLVSTQVSHVAATSPDALPHYRVPAAPCAPADTLAALPLTPAGDN